MKKILKYILILIAISSALPAQAALLSPGGSRAGGILIPQFELFTNDYTGIIPANGLNIGSPAQPVPSIYTTTLFASSSVFSSLTGTGTTTFTGGIYVGTGFSSYPEYSFNADTNTGIDLTGTGVMNLVTGGSNRITINSTGSVGISTSSPFAKLSVAGDAYIGGNLTATGTANVVGGLTVSSSAGVSTINVTDLLGTGSGGLLRLSNKAFTSATAGLQVFGGNSISNSSGQFIGVNVVPVISQSGSASYTALVVNPTDSSLGSGTSYIADFQNGGVSRFNVTNTGNVGISTTSPRTILSVDKGPTATTTVSFGARTCFNVGNTVSTTISFYFVGTTMVTENNACR